MSRADVPVGGGIEEACASASLSIAWKNCSMVDILLVSNIRMWACLYSVFLGMIEKWIERSMEFGSNVIVGRDVVSIIVRTSSGCMSIGTVKCK